MSMPSNKSLRIFSLIAAMLPSTSERVSHQPSGSKGCVAKRGKNHADRRRSYNKVKK